MSCCAATGCYMPLRRGMVMCAAHWQMVPEGHQKALTASWRARLTSDYQECVRLAIEHIEALEERYCDALGNPLPSPLTGPAFTAEQAENSQFNSSLGAPVRRRGGANSTLRKPSRRFVRVPFLGVAS